MKFYTVTFGCKKLAEKCEKELLRKANVRCVCYPKDDLNPKGWWTVSYMPVGSEAFTIAREVVGKYIHEDMQMM